MANSVVSLGQVQMIGDQVQDRWFIDQISAKTVVFQNATGKLTIFNPNQQSFRKTIPGYHVLNVLISVSGGHPAVVQLMLSPLSFSLNPSLKISLHQLRRESNCLWAISRILFLPATRYTFILPKNDLFHTFQPTSPIKTLPKGFF